MEHNVLPLFSSPVYTSYIDITPLPNFNSIEWISDTNRDYSKSNRILEESAWSSIKNQILKHIEQYFYRILMANSTIEIAITSSWLNKNNIGQVHQRHTHPNSILSGVLFFDFHDTGIVFVDTKYQQVLYEKTEFNIFNSQEWTVKPEPGLLLLWPSYLAHEVGTINSTRYSLSFNTWIYGDINNSHNMNLTITQQ
jgi:hypothetical protein